jgi:two-component system, chemotaxis family, protein-glutamate methylesterase/glutaminase
VRVLIVDDSAFMRKMIKEMISSDPAFEVVGIARDGNDAIEQALKHKPDLITLDIEMPNKDGLSALREIKAKCHAFSPAVLMCSSLTVDGSHEALKAMRIGAADVIGKDPSVVGKNDVGFKEELLGKLHAIGEHQKLKQAPKPSRPKVDNSIHSSADQLITGQEIDLSRVEAVVVGSSTGGPPVLEEIFSKLSANLRVPIIVAQHMPELFTKSLATRLDQHCSCRATLAKHGTILSNPGIYIAQGGKHIKPTRIAGGKIVTRLVDTIEGAIYRPSVDLLFSRGASLFGENLLAIQLTGMGTDGELGADAVHQAGGQIIAQSADSCVVYGMPKAVIDRRIADQVMDPKGIRDLLMLLSNAPNIIDETATSPNSVHRRSA